MTRPAALLVLLLAAAGGGKSGPEPRPSTTTEGAGSAPVPDEAGPDEAGPDEAGPDEAGPDEATGAPADPGTAATGDSHESTASGGPSGNPAEPDFEAPFPSEPCPDAVRVRLAHAQAPELPPLLDRAVALRSADGRRVRLAIANHELARDARGRFSRPGPGEARFEADAVRRRRGPLEPGVLGPPTARRGGLTHARVVTAAAGLTFGHRDIGRVELTALSDQRVCGRIALDDGFGRLRGAFTAPVVGPVP